MGITCKTCQHNKNKICMCSLSNHYKAIIKDSDTCLYMQRYSEQNVIIRNGAFSKKEIEIYINHLHQKHPDTHFGTITFDQDGDHVLITYEVLPDNVERIRKLPDNL